MIQYCCYYLHTIACSCVDLRTGAFDVPPQEILTRDSVTVTVDAVVYYQVASPANPLPANPFYLLILSTC